MAEWYKGLIQLGLQAEDWGPTCHGVYQELADNWRGSVAVPTEAALTAAINEYNTQVQPLEDWERQMAATDITIPRYMEDHIREEHGGVVADPTLQVNYNAKVALRGTKP